MAIDRPRFRLQFISKGLQQVLLWSVFLFTSVTAQAQLTPDGTLGAESSRVVPRVLGGDQIEGGAIRGSNLFHSFSDFNVGDRQRVYFANPTGIQNILTRVTGSTLSNINGTLGVDGAANLFLLNPNGILFEQNARLDVRGSFVATTASAMQFGSQGGFSASDSAAPPLLTVDPSALLFNQLKNGSIINRSRTSDTVMGGANLYGLKVTAGENLVLAGGNVTLDGGGIYGEGGRVEIGAVAGTGKVELNWDGRLTLLEEIERGNISVRNGSQVIVISDDSDDIAITGRNIIVAGQSWLGIASNTPNSQAGSLTLNATDKIQIEGSSPLFNNVVNGNAGEIKIVTGTLSISDGASIQSKLLGIGKAGDITISARDRIVIEGRSNDPNYTTGISSNIDTGAVGKGGNLTIETSSLSLLQRASFNTSTFGQGDAGNIEIKVSEQATLKNSLIVSNVQLLEAIGNGGNINVKVGALSLQDGGQINAFTRGRGNTGNISIQAQGTVSLEGIGSDGFLSGVFLDVNNGAIGQGGTLNIQARSIFLKDGSQIGASTYGTGKSGDITISARDRIVIEGRSNDPDYTTGIRSDIGAGAVGKGGNLTIETGSLSLLQRASLNTSTLGKGDAGNIEIKVSEQATLKNSLIISNVQSSEAIGNGGSINVKVGALSLQDGGQINTFTRGQGDTGNISIQARDTIFLQGIGSDGFLSGVFLDINDGAIGQGGTLNIQARSIFLKDGSQISASTYGRGNSGTIQIDAQDAIVLEKINDSAVIYSGVGENAVGNGGDIRITTGELSIIGGAQINAETNGKGNSANVIINATGAVILDGRGKDRFPSGAFSSVEPGAIGNGGDIKIQSASLSLLNDAQLGTSTEGRGDSGDVVLNINGDTLIDRSSIFTEVTRPRNDNEGGFGIGGDIVIDANNVFITNGAQLRSDNENQGKAGNIIITSRGGVVFDGFGIIGFTESGIPGIGNSAASSTVEPGAVGDGGDIKITAKYIEIKRSSPEGDRTTRLDTRTEGNGKAGNIFLQADDYILLSDASISSEVSSEGIKSGGDINIVTRSLELVDNAQINASTEGQGNAGNIVIKASEQVNLQNQSSVMVSSQSNATAGSIEVTSPLLRLRDRGKLSADSAAVDGGNIILNNREALILRRNSIISTNAGTKQQGGNGGNIAINAGTILAIPEEDNSISANAFMGRGGNITINTNALLGMTPGVDITASSALGVQGEVSITQPEVQPTQGILELSTEVLDASNQISQVCPRGSAGQRIGRFVNSGYGSLPPNPIEPLTGSTAIPLATIEGSPTTTIATVSTPNDSEIVEAQGWVKTTDGKVTLVAQAAETTPSSRPTANCSIVTQQ